MKEKLMELINSEFYVPMRERDICYILGASAEEEKKEISESLLLLENEGMIVRNSKNKYLRLTSDSQVKKGVFRQGSGNFGFVRPDGGGEDIYISPKNVFKAEDGDKVTVSIIAHRTEDKKAEGKIIRIDEKGDNTVSGIVLRGKHGLFVMTPRGTYDLAGTMGAKRNDVVLVREKGNIGSIPGRKYATVCKVVGNMDDEDINMKLAIAKYDIPVYFDQEVIRHANGLYRLITTEDLSARRDLRAEKIFTIDSESAKDLDDAVGISYDGEIYVLKVSIADVSHFVKSGDIIDKAAYERGTSVYFPTSAVHMLPGELCENLCSLSPEADRLAFTVEMHIDNKGRVVESDFYKSVIRSCGKLTYEKVNRFLDGDGTVDNIYMELSEELHTMKSLWKILDEKRAKRGSIDLDMPESSMYINGGRIEDIFLRQRGTAERIIEEFMLITNTTVAEFIANTGVCSLYRSHEDPDKEKLEQFRTNMSLMGRRLRLKDEHYSGMLNKFLDSVVGEDDEFIIRKMLLRCMKKACYSTEGKSHFALGYDYYTHFTSPIRRYPDLVVHRILSDIISGNLTMERMENLSATLPEVASETSRLERRAEDAERFCEKLYMAAYVDEYRDEVFTGIISGVVKSGFFVQLANLIEGFVPLHTMEDDYYISDTSAMKITGRNHGDVYSIGDVVEVMADSVNLLTGDIDFYLI